MSLCCYVIPWWKIELQQILILPTHMWLKWFYSAWQKILQLEHFYLAKKHKLCSSTHIFLLAGVDKYNSNHKILCLAHVLTLLFLQKLHKCFLFLFFSPLQNFTLGSLSFQAENYSSSPHSIHITTAHLCFCCVHVPCCPEKQKLGKNNMLTQTRLMCSVKH